MPLPADKQATSLLIHRVDQFGVCSPQRRGLLCWCFKKYVATVQPLQFESSVGWFRLLRLTEQHCRFHSSRDFRPFRAFWLEQLLSVCTEPTCFSWATNNCSLAVLRATMATTDTDAAYRCSWRRILRRTGNPSFGRPGRLGILD